MYDRQKLQPAIFQLALRQSEKMCPNGVKFNHFLRDLFQSFHGKRRVRLVVVARPNHPQPIRGIETEF